MPPKKDKRTDKEKDADGNEGQMVSDPRFAAVHYDPRFQRFPKAKTKVKIDERFAGMFNDPSFQVTSVIDKRGRKVKKSSKINDDMKRYYHLQDEEDQFAKATTKHDDEKDASKKKKTTKASKKEQPKDLKPNTHEDEDDSKLPEEAPLSSSDDESLDTQEREAQERWARMRGLAGPETSSSEEDSDGSSSSEDDDQALESESEDEELIREWGIGAMAANPEEKIPMLNDATARIAAVDLDWENIRAVDILVALRSFLPQGGRVESVTVYPSDYGLERMKEEAEAGPKGIWKNSSAAAGENDSEDSEEEEDGKVVEEMESSEDEDEEEELDDLEHSSDESDEDENKNAALVQGKSKKKKALTGRQKQLELTQKRAEAKKQKAKEEQGALDQQRLQLYERSKLRWYFAVIVCDCATTADRLYSECDGMELMKTANKFDLRFIPDDKSFAGRQIRDEATSIPDDYEPPVFQTKALQHTNIELTWDADDGGRKRALSKKLTADELKDDDFKAYLASETEEESEDERGGGQDGEALRERYRNLLLNGGGKDSNGVPKERKGKKDWAGDDESDSGSGSEEEDEEKHHVNRDKDMEMEVTFMPGLENLGQRLLSKKKDEKDRQGETVWDAYMRRRREKKAEAKRLGKSAAFDSDDDQGSDPSDKEDDSDDDDVPAGVADDPFFQHEENPFDDPFFNDGGEPGQASDEENDGGAKKSSKKKKKDSSTSRKDKLSTKEQRDKDAAEERRRKAELEMLLMDEEALLLHKKKSNTTAAADDDGQQQQPQKKKLSKKERARLKKEAKRRQREVGSDDDELQNDVDAGFQVNLDDPRFADLYKGQDFALDPTDPRFSKAGPGASTLAKEVAKRRSKGVKREGGSGKRVEKESMKRDDKVVAVNSGGGGKEKADLKLLVASLKRKAAEKELVSGKKSKNAGF